jgi:hypothetical protein
MTATQRATKILSAIASPVTSLPDRIIDWLSRLPSTNARIAATIFCMMGTAFRYWWTAGGPGQWQPSYEWLAFLAVMAGIDTAQFNVKRKTHSGAPTPPPSAPE